MKKLLLFLFALVLTTAIYAEDNYPIIDTMHYDATSGQPLEYNNTFNISGVDHVSTSLPIADHLYISGCHLEFSISDEFQLSKIIRQSSATGYFDLQITLYSGNNSTSTGILRIYITQ